MLDSLGLSETMLRVYQAVLDHPGHPADQIGSLHDLGPTVLEDAICRLRALHLIVPDDSSTADSAVHPRLAIPALIRRRRLELNSLTDELERAQADADRLLVDLDRQGVPAPVHTVHSLHGPNEVQAWLRNIVPRKSIRCLSTARCPQYSLAAWLNPAPGLFADVDCRMVCLESSATSRDSADQLEGLTASGARVRTVSALPMDILIIDNDAVVIAPRLALDPAATVYYSDEVVELAHTTFDISWQGGRDAAAKTSTDRSRPTTQERGFLKLVAGGATDEYVARRMGVSIRTVRRIAAGLCELTGAGSRFELAVQATRRGWIA